MSKKKRSTAKRGNKQSFNNSGKSYQVLRPRRSSMIIRFLANQLLSTVFKAIFEQHIKDLLSLMWTWLFG